MLREDNKVVYVNHSEIKADCRQNNVDWSFRRSFGIP